ncbi:MAG: flavin reductase family protein [Deltaproteobacteria bacterium]|nr:flavin reductase family protein [Deltaproteobacteria bacterium]
MNTGKEIFVEVPPEHMDRVIGNYNPVVIITTRNNQGESNAAPFAMCMEVCHNPPFIAFGVGESKDTYHNVKRTGEFVINVAGEDILKKLMVTAKRYPPEVNELAEARLHELPGVKVTAARIAECKIHFECRVEWIKEAGDHFVVLGRVVSVTVDKDALTEDFKIRIDKIKPVHYRGRGTDIFLTVGSSIRMPR